MNRILYIFIFVVISCSCSERKPEIISNNLQTETPINLLDCKTATFSVIAKEVNKILPSLYPECTEFKVAYQELTQDEKDVMATYMQETIDRVTRDSPEKDSSVYSQEFLFTDLKACGKTIDYDSVDNCSFYAGAIYHSKDFKVQFVRLFQTGRNEYFDVYLNLSGPKPELMAYG